jgi:hypothetical protein
MNRGNLVFWLAIALLIAVALVTWEANNAQRPIVVANPGESETQYRLPTNQPLEPPAN